MVVVRGVSQARIVDDAFWGLLFKLAVYRSEHNTFDKLYDLLLPFLSEENKPYEQLLAESERDEFMSFHSPQRSNTSAVRCYMEAGQYSLSIPLSLHSNITVFLFPFY